MSNITNKTKKRSNRTGKPNVHFLRVHDRDRQYFDDKYEY